MRRRACWWWIAQRGTWEDRQFRELPEYLGAGDCLVLNDSRVFPARLFGHARRARGHVEVLLLRPVDGGREDWEALVHPGQEDAGGREDSVRGRAGGGSGRAPRIRRAHVALSHGRGRYEAFEKIGHVPLPPYIKRRTMRLDRQRYQTVFAREKGSAAAPTAGLHFTPEVLDACRAAGADIAFVTLHVGLGTFQPIHDGRVEGHHLHSEHYRITAENAAPHGVRPAPGGRGHHQRTHPRKRHAETAACGRRAAKRTYLFTRVSSFALPARC